MARNKRVGKFQVKFLSDKTSGLDELEQRQDRNHRRACLKRLL